MIWFDRILYYMTWHDMIWYIIIIYSTVYYIHMCLPPYETHNFRGHVEKCPETQCTHETFIIIQTMLLECTKRPRIPTPLSSCRVYCAVFLPGSMPSRKGSLYNQQWQPNKIQHLVETVQLYRQKQSFPLPIPFKKCSTCSRVSISV